MTPLIQSSYSWFQYYEWIGPVAWLTVIISVCFAFWFHNADYIAMSAIGVAILSSLLRDTVIYKILKCPSRKENLCHYKNGNRMPDDVAIRELYSYRGCRHCGWQPSVGS